jgi:hypothetical protein
MCGHNEVVEAQPKVDMHPLYIAYAPRPPENVMSQAGFLWAYSCRRCDYAQLFVEEASKLPIGPTHDTRLVIGAPGAGAAR